MAATFFDKPEMVRATFPLKIPLTSESAPASRCVAVSEVTTTIEKIINRWIDIFIRTFNRASDWMPAPRLWPTSRKIPIELNYPDSLSEKSMQAQSDPVSLPLVKFGLNRARQLPDVA